MKLWNQYPTSKWCDACPYLQNYKHLEEKNARRVKYYKLNDLHWKLLIFSILWKKIWNNRRFSEIVGIMNRVAVQALVNWQRLNNRPPIPRLMGELGEMLQNWTCAANIFKGQFTADDESVECFFYDETMLLRFCTASEAHIDGTFKVFTLLFFDWQSNYNHY